jgi:cytochrome c
MKLTLPALAGIALVAGAMATTAVAVDELRAQPADAESMVKTAVSYLKKHGREKAFKEFQNKNGPFIYRDLYLFVYDLKGDCLAHGADPTRVGKNFATTKDAVGTPFMAERLELMKVRTSAWQDYKFKNPANGRVEAKTAYLEKYKDLIVGSGAYKL